MDNNEYDLNGNSLLTPSSTSPPSTLTAHDDTTTETQLIRARLILENHIYEDLLNRYNMAMTRLGELASEANSLQEENEWVRLANEELIRRLNRLLPIDNEPVTGGLNNYNVVGNNSPTSVINDNYNEERFLLPKSISVRSPKYFKLKSSLPSTPTSNNNITTTAITPNNVATTLNQTLRRRSPDAIGTRLRFRRNVEKSIEMDVYNQGMYKTELCNKWQETNTCPYGDHCRFAHGLSELRPVIRHPRYKSQVCRMIVAGVPCPYGHRCHFSHSTSASTTRLN